MALTARGSAVSRGVEFKGVDEVIRAHGASERVRSRVMPERSKGAVSRGTRHLDPPVRLRWVGILPSHKQATALLREYLTTRVKHVPMGSEATKGEHALAAESRACKTMLRHLDMAQADGNTMGVELAIRKGREWGTVVVYFWIKGVGNVAWLPTLATGSNSRLAHIIRETGVNRVMIDPVAREAADKDNEGSPRRNVPPKVETRLIPGKTI